MHNFQLHLFDPFLDFLHDLKFLLGLEAFSLLVENFHLLYLMIGEFEFGLDVVVLVLQDLSLLSDTLGLNFVFLSADFIVYTILLHRQCMDMCH